MKILNFGSLNIDFVYSLPHFVKPGETLDSEKMERFAGGKGLNQSVALANAGVEVYHAGSIGKDGIYLKEILNKAGVNTKFLRTLDCPTGHAVIQVEPSGQNSIILFAGANHRVDNGFIETVFNDFNEGDWLLIQNEINRIPDIIEYAHKKGMRIALNPSPMNEEILKWKLDKISCFLINEVEGAQIAGTDDPEKICEIMNMRYPDAITVLTLGNKGALYSFKGKLEKYPIVESTAVDTTAAGDTFTGYFLASVMRGESSKTAMMTATCASAIAVTKPGAAGSIPQFGDVKKLLDSLNI